MKNTSTAKEQGSAPGKNTGISVTQMLREREQIHLQPFELMPRLQTQRVEGNKELKVSDTTSNAFN